MKKVKLHRGFLEGGMNIIFLLCALISICFVILTVVFLIINGLPAIRKIGGVNLLFGKIWASTASEPKYGILPFILSSICGTFGAILIGVPIGLLCAVFMAKYIPRRFSKVMEPVIDLLSGIPSVVYGLVGMIVVVPVVRDLFNLSDGANLCSAIIVLSIMILPSVISVSENAIKSVPKEYEEASLALGATKTETIFKIVVPSAKSGILASVVLGIGRAIGESMAVMMVSGNVANMPRLFRSVRFLTTAVASEMSYSSGLQREALFSIALVLFVFIMIVNIILNRIVKRGDKNE